MGVDRVQQLRGIVAARLDAEAGASMIAFPCPQQKPLPGGLVAMLLIFGFVVLPVAGQHMIAMRSATIKIAQADKISTPVPFSGAELRSKIKPYTLKYPQLKNYAIKFPFPPEKDG